MGRYDTRTATHGATHRLPYTHADRGSTETWKIGCHGPQPSNPMETESLSKPLVSPETSKDSSSFTVETEPRRWGKEEGQPNQSHDSMVEEEVHQSQKAQFSTKMFRSRRDVMTYQRVEPYQRRRSFHRRQSFCSHKSFHRRKPYRRHKSPFWRCTEVERTERMKTTQTHCWSTTSPFQNHPRRLLYEKDGGRPGCGEERCSGRRGLAI